MTSTDEELVARSISGDTDSFNELILRWERPIYALAYRTIGREEDARDVCQETFLRAFRALPGFRGQAKFSSWLYRIALNLCRDWMRRERRRRSSRFPKAPMPIELAAAVEPSESIEDLVARRDLTRVVERVMARLPEEQRTAIVLKEYHGLTFQEIADLVGCPLSTVKTRLYQGLTVLRRELAKDGATCQHRNCHDEYKDVRHLRRTIATKPSSSTCTGTGRGTRAHRSSDTWQRCAVCRTEIEALRAFVRRSRNGRRPSRFARSSTRRRRGHGSQHASPGSRAWTATDATCRSGRRRRPPCSVSALDWVPRIFVSATDRTGSRCAPDGCRLTRRRSPLAAASPVDGQAAPWRAELTALEQQLRADLKPAPCRGGRSARAGRRGDDSRAATVRALIAQSEQRQQRELALRIGDLLNDVQVAAPRRPVEDRSQHRADSEQHRHGSVAAARDVELAGGPRVSQRP